MSFGYFYGDQSESYSFYRFPKQLLVGEQFKRLSMDARVLYGLMLDRMGLSAKNGWRDEQGRVYIYYTVTEIQEDFNCGHDRVLRMLSELDSEKGIGLIERKKQGQGRPTIIYVKQFTQTELPPLPSPSDQCADSRLRETRSLENGKVEVQTSEKPKSRHREGKAEVQTSEKPKEMIIIKTILIRAILIHQSLNQMDGRWNRACESRLISRFWLRSTSMTIPNVFCS